VYGLIERPHLQFYIPLAQLDSAGVVRWPVVAVLVRTTGAAAEMVHNVQHAIVTGSTGLPYPKVAVVGDRFDRSLREWRLGSALLLVLGGVGLLLAAVGLHGLLRYLVTRRMRELAIRISLGADPRRLVWRVVGDGLRITIPGLVVGAACAVAVGHATAAFLYGVSAVDTASLLGTTIVLLLATGAATYIPARRAASIDPVAVLRSE
jgi:ABC-type antimicrobial peptide transport system permease subunit